MFLDVIEFVLTFASQKKNAKITVQLLVSWFC